MKIGVSTDVGKIREINQDAFYYSNINELPLYVVADGMGGHNAGEIASSIAIESVKNLFLEKSDKLLNREIEIPEFINEALSNANEKILKQASSVESCKGMGTTITMAFIFNNELYIGHLGDSRAYLLRDGQLIQITQDHSLVAELVRKGSITEEEANNHPQKNIITRALGTEKEIKTDIFSRDIEKDDLILLCTDGLTNMVSNEKIRDILLSTNDLQEACNILTSIANNLGGLDNTTVLVIGIE